MATKIQLIRSSPVDFQRFSTETRSTNANISKTLLTLFSPIAQKVTDYSTISSYLCYLKYLAEEVNMNYVNIRLYIGATIKGGLLNLRKFLATECPLKIMENTFNLNLKALLVLKIFKFCLQFLVMLENGLNKKIGLISNIHDVTTC